MVTATGESRVVNGLVGKGVEGASIEGRRPVQNRVSSSFGVAGFEAVTREKSLECVTAGPAGVDNNVGDDMGITCN